MKVHIFELRIMIWRYGWSYSFSSCEIEPWKNSGLNGYITLYGYITNSQSGQHPVGSIAQLVKHCTSIVKVMGSNPVQNWIFSQLLEVVCILNNDDQPYLHIRIELSSICSAAQHYFIQYHLIDLFHLEKSHVSWNFRDDIKLRIKILRYHYKIWKGLIHNRPISSLGAKLKRKVKK